jgi:hypothetical protein
MPQLLRRDVRRVKTRSLVINKRYLAHCDDDGLPAAVIVHTRLRALQPYSASLGREHLNLTYSVQPVCPQ